jgi:hypothetical protein
VSGKSERDDLSSPVRQQTVEPHHAALDAVDVSLSIAFIKCVLMRFEMPQMGIVQQVL